MDEDLFAQSREPDDLFSDEIEFADTPAPPQDNAQSQASPPSAPTAPKARNESRGANNNARPQQGSRRGDHGSRGQTHPHKQEPSQPNPAATQQEGPSASPAAQPAAPEEARVTSVRGDRSATGPAKPQKRTEAELTELMASMQVKNAAKTAAFARAEKDHENFLRREQQAAAKRVEERKTIREQDAERAKNRERKIKAQGGREWDSEKVESDIVDRRGGSSGFMRGAHGGVAGQRAGGGGLSSSRYSGAGGEDGDAESGGRGGYRGRYGDGGPRGRGGRGGRGARGRGTNFNGSSQTPASVPSDADFPSLPAKPSTNKPAESAAKVDVVKDSKLGGLSDSTWAEEMATAVENV